MSHDYAQRFEARAEIRDIMDQSESETVLVTGTGGGGLGAGILKALGTRWRTVAVDTDPYAWGLYAADAGEIVPRAEAPDYLDRLLEIIERHDVRAVLPGTEAETALLARHRKALPVPVIANDAALMPLMESKVAMADKLRALGAPTIPYYSWSQRATAVADWGFPLVVKPAARSSGSRDVHLVSGHKDLDQLPIYFGLSRPMIIQPYVAGTEYTVGVLSSMVSRMVMDSIVIRRALSGLSLRARSGDAAISTGTSQGTIVADPRIQAFCEDLAFHLGSSGPLNLQLRERNGRFYVFDVHPRFSGTTPIRASAGFNEPDVLLRSALRNETFGRLWPRLGVVALRTYEHILVPEADILTQREPLPASR